MEMERKAQKQIFIPFTAFSQAFNTSNDVGWMAITAHDGIVYFRPERSNCKSNEGEAQGTSG